MSDNQFGQVGSVGGIVLGLFLVIFGAGMLLSLAIPTWAIGLLAVIAGLLILIGR